MAIDGNFSPIPPMCTLNTTILAKKNSWKFHKFSRKIYIVYKIGHQNEFGRVFEVLLPGYVAIIGDFSSIQPMCISDTAILYVKIFWVFFQFSRKIYIVCKIGLKMSLVRFWTLTPWLGGNQWRFQCYSTHVYTKYYHSGQTEFLKTS